MSRIYLVDDHVMMRDGVAALLRAAGHEVAGESADPTVALSEIQRLRPALVLLDLKLGPRSGFELLAELHKRRFEVRAIVLTMSSQAHDVAEAMRLGAAGYLLKGAPSADLLQAIDAVQAGRRYLSAEVAELAVQGLTAVDEQVALRSLSPRERQMVALVVRGHSSAAIGALLHLSPKTVDSYRSRLMSKLGVADVPALVRFAIRAGLIAADER
ncbi:MAG: response regulator transcription factor [Burkholderiales bacterium]|nr:response regulator transcription factor [Burkholderiales bacterium]MDE2159064.1 response regulator transcription factor [Burkholderiales bacterium]MDE2501773.1 response regulator transcription factor [Burkholderiales bacterium]